MRDAPEIESEVAGWVEDLGYELVELRWGGSGQRPLIKLRIDRLPVLFADKLAFDIKYFLKSLSCLREVLLFFVPCGNRVQNLHDRIV